MTSVLNGSASREESGTRGLLLAMGFELGEQIGKGSFGEVFTVKRLSDRVRCVAKKINLASLPPKQRSTAVQEAYCLATLNHPNIIKYIESFEHESLLFIILEYADGGDVYTYLQHQALTDTYLSEDQIMSWFVQLCLALKHVHDKRILHRDLKTPNIFLTSTGMVKLGDFGLSTILSNTSTMARTLCGTPYYFSPEMCRQEPYNNKSDVWALGCLLFEFCTLKLAFRGHNLKTLVQNIKDNKRNEIPTFYSTALKVLVNQVLAHDHRKRPSVNNILDMPFVQKHLQKHLDRLNSGQPLLTINPKNLSPVAAAAPTYTTSNHVARVIPTKKEVGDEVVGVVPPKVEYITNIDNFIPNSPIAILTSGHPHYTSDQTSTSDDNNYVTNDLAAVNPQWNSWKYYNSGGGEGYNIMGVELNNQPISKPNNKNNSANDSSAVRAHHQHQHQHQQQYPTITTPVRNNSDQHPHYTNSTLNVENQATPLSVHSVNNSSSGMSKFNSPTTRRQHQAPVPERSSYSPDLSENASSEDNVNLSLPSSPATAAATDTINGSTDYITAHSPFGGMQQASMSSSYPPAPPPLTVHNDNSLTILHDQMQRIYQAAMSPLHSQTTVSPQLSLINPSNNTNSPVMDLSSPPPATATLSPNMGLNTPSQGIVPVSPSYSLLSVSTELVATQIVDILQHGAQVRGADEVFYDLPPVQDPFNSHQQHAATLDSAEFSKGPWRIHPLTTDTATPKHLSPATAEGMHKRSGGYSGNTSSVNQSSSSEFESPTSISSSAGGGAHYHASDDHHVASQEWSDSRNESLVRYLEGDLGMETLEVAVDLLRAEEEQNAILREHERVLELQMAEILDLDNQEVTLTHKVVERIPHPPPSPPPAHVQHTSSGAAPPRQRTSIQL